MSLLAFQTGDPRWCSFLQTKERGWNVKKGSKATKAAKERGEEPDEEGKTGRMLRHYPVFHASQIEGIPEYKPPGIDEAPWTRPEAADLILKNSGAVIRTGGDRAFYSPSTDHIQLPPDNAFRGPAEFAAVALHELSLWSGHPSRLNREDGMKARYGSGAYAMEELRAELASAFIAAELGIPSEIAGHASYIQSWLKPLKEDRRAIFHAAADAQRVVDMVLGFHPDFAARIVPQPDRPHAQSNSQPEQRLEA
jgi:antirestriction protein ArdC